MASPNPLLQELQTVREAVGIHETKNGHLRLQGPDASSYLHRMTSNDVEKMAVGSGFYNALLDRKGMVLSLFYMIRPSADEFLIVTPPQLTQKTLGILTKSKFIEKVNLTDESQKRVLFLMIGPEAENEVKEKVKEFPAWKEDIFAVPVWNVSVPQSALETFKKTFSHLPSVSEEAVRLMKMSVGFPEYGTDIDENHILLEARVPMAHKRQKGCYPGQEVIERITAYGKGRTPKSIVRLTSEGLVEVTLPATLFSETGEEVGKMTSALFNPLEQKNYALASLDHQYVDGAQTFKKVGNRLVL